MAHSGEGERLPHASLGPRSPLGPSRGQRVCSSPRVPESLCEELKSRQSPATGPPCRALAVKSSGSGPGLWGGGQCLPPRGHLVPGGLALASYGCRTGLLLNTHKWATQPHGAKLGNWWGGSSAPSLWRDACSCRDPSPLSPRTVRGSRRPHPVETGANRGVTLAGRLTRGGHPHPPVFFPTLVSDGRPGTPFQRAMRQSAKNASPPEERESSQLESQGG